MDFTQLKVLAFCVAVLALVGCGTASKTTEYVKPQSLQVISMADDAQPGDRVSIPINSGLGMGTVVVDQSYIAASGRQCRRLRTVDGTLIQRVACQGGDGVWSLARDLRPISPIDPVVSSTSVVRNTSELNQPLVPSVGSAMLLNEQSSLSSNTLSHDSIETLVASTNASLVQASAKVSEISHAELAKPVGAEPAIIIPAEYAAPVAVMPTQISSVDASIQTSDESFNTNPDESVVAEYAASPEALPAQVSVAEAIIQANGESVNMHPDEFVVEVEEYTAPPEALPIQISVTEGLIQANGEPVNMRSDEFVLEEYAAPVEPVPAAARIAQDSMQARAEALIISREQYAQQVGVPLLDIGSNNNSTPISDEPPSLGADASEIETVTRTLNVNETLWSFAKRTTGNALNWETIARINGISDAKTLATGTQLLVPAELVGQGG